MIHGLFSLIFFYTIKKDTCDLNGMRLCTMSEISNEETLSSGCSFENSIIWSSTECTPKAVIKKTITSTTTWEQAKDVCTAEGLDMCKRQSVCVDGWPGKQLINKGGSGCTASNKCTNCQGDCDRDSDCVDGLKCFQRNGYGPVPGCSPNGDGDKKGYDYCYEPGKTIIFYFIFIFIFLFALIVVTRY